MCLFADGIASKGAARLDLKSNKAVTLCLPAAVALPVACSIELGDCPKFTLLTAWFIFREGADVIGGVPSNRFQKAFAISGHRLSPGRDFPEKRPVRFRV